MKNIDDLSKKKLYVNLMDLTFLNFPIKISNFCIFSKDEFIYQNNYLNPSSSEENYFYFPLNLDKELNKIRISFYINTMQYIFETDCEDEIPSLSISIIFAEDRITCQYYYINSEKKKIIKKKQSLLKKEYIAFNFGTKEEDELFLKRLLNDVSLDDYYSNESMRNEIVRRQNSDLYFKSDLLIENKNDQKSFVMGFYEKYVSPDFNYIDNEENNTLNSEIENLNVNNDNLNNNVGNSNSDENSDKSKNSFELMILEYKEYLDEENARNKNKIEELKNEIKGLNSKIDIKDQKLKEKDKSMDQLNKIISGNDKLIMEKNNKIDLIKIKNENLEKLIKEKDENLEKLMKEKDENFQKQKKEITERENFIKEKENTIIDKLEIIDSKEKIIRDLIEEIKEKDESIKVKTANEHALLEDYEKSQNKISSLKEQIVLKELSEKTRILNKKDDNFNEETNNHITEQDKKIKYLEEYNQSLLLQIKRCIASDNFNKTRKISNDNSTGNILKIRCNLELVIKKIYKIKENGTPERSFPDYINELFNIIIFYLKNFKAQNQENQGSQILYSRDSYVDQNGVFGFLQCLKCIDLNYFLRIIRYCRSNFTIESLKIIFEKSTSIYGHLSTSIHASYNDQEKEIDDIECFENESEKLVYIIFREALKSEI